MCRGGGASGTAPNALVLGRRLPLRKPFPACSVAEEDLELIGYISMFARTGRSATIQEL